MISGRNEFAEARAAEHERALVQGHRAALVVAANASDPEDCRSLLMMLGLTPDAEHAEEPVTS